MSAKACITMNYKKLRFVRDSATDKIKVFKIQKVLISQNLRFSHIGDGFNGAFSVLFFTV
jgi:hypothetical protein